MNVWMLDHDPVTAARSHSDQHVKSALFTYAQTLAFAWHSLHNEMYALMEGNDDVTPPTPWFKCVHVAAPYTSSKDRPRSLFPGESPWTYWTLFGQRVPSRRMDAPNASELWVEQSGGNYRWLWQCASELVAEYRWRFGTKHPASPAVWTLEMVPPVLDTTLDSWAETPVDTIPQHLRVVVDGFYDVVATNKRFYNTHQHQLTWTRRKPPAWLTQEAEPTQDE